MVEPWAPRRAARQPVHGAPRAHAVEQVVVSRRGAIRDSQSESSTLERARASHGLQRHRGEGVKVQSAKQWVAAGLVAAAAHLFVVLFAIAVGACNPPPSEWLGAFAAALGCGYLLDVAYVLHRRRRRQESV